MKNLCVPFVLLVLSVPISTAEAQDSQLRPASWRSNYSSQRIETLRRQFAAGNQSTDAFWAEIAKMGTPLIEPSDPDDQHQLVTFLWRGTTETHNVLVVWSPFTGVRPQDYLMTRLEDSDVWYLVARIPAGARFLYQLAHNDPLDSRALGVWVGRSPQPDPLNPHRFGSQSVVELPGAPLQPWIAKHPETPEGTVEEHQIRSELLDAERTVSVYTPAAYHADAEPRHVLVLFDKEYYQSAIPVPVILDNLISASRIPPVVAVLISNRGTRGPDLINNETFTDFVAKELIPWVRSRYHVTDDPAQAIVGGLSAGGIAAMHTGLRHSDTFGNVLSQSGAFYLSPALSRELATRAPASDVSDRHILEEIEDRAATEGNWLISQYVRSPRLLLKFYMDVGSFEADFMGQGGAVLESNRHLRDVLLAKGYAVHYQQFIGGHDYISWRGTFADGLIALIGHDGR